MTIPDYVAFGVLIVLFVLNVAAAFADRKRADQTNAQNDRFVSRS
jgi:hypothetical protein